MLPVVVEASPEVGRGTQNPEWGFILGGGWMFPGKGRK